MQKAQRGAPSDTQITAIDVQNAATTALTFARVFRPSAISSAIRIEYPASHNGDYVKHNRNPQPRNISQTRANALPSASSFPESTNGPNRAAASNAPRTASNCSRVNRTVNRSNPSAGSAACHRSE